MPVPTLFGAFGKGTVTPPPVLTTWNPADKSASITLSGGNLTATEAPGAGTPTSGVRSTSNHTTGKYHVEITYSGAQSGAFPLAGFCTAAAVLTNNTLGSDLFSITYQADGPVFCNNVNLGSAGSYTSGNLIAFEIDFATKQIWVERLGGSGRKGPYSYAAITGTPALFFVFESAGSTEAGILNAGASAFSITPTSGFSAWG